MSLKIILLTCFFVLQAGLSFSQKKYFQQKVNYSIDVSLNDQKKTLEGFEQIYYTNNSTDTLTYIWFHLWPNAFKNDRTAFSEQLLQLDRTDFYFSKEEDRGYINRLDFKVNDITANLEDHPQYIDVAKLILPEPLAPGKTIKITTPFHVKLPFNFSRGGFKDHTFQVTQWYPKPAVYDIDGWHPMPYLDQGEFFSEFGNFHVRITVPSNYIVAATGTMESENEANIWQNQKGETHRSSENKNISSEAKSTGQKKKYQPFFKKKRTQIVDEPESTFQSHSRTNTYNFTQDRIHDFAWFADKNFIVKHDTIQLPSSRVVNAFVYYKPESKELWAKSMQFVKSSVRARSKWIGEYPYDVVKVVEARLGTPGGMEYPTICNISGITDEKDLDETISHEIGHNWLYGALASNERQYPWMDEGMNTFFDEQYEKLKYPSQNESQSQNFIEKRLPSNEENFIYRIQVKRKKDQPIETASQDFSFINYDVIAYYKTSLWLKQLEIYLGKQMIDSCFHEYYKLWKFKHPYPDDFKNVIEETSHKNIDSFFTLLQKKGPLTKPGKREFKLSALFNLRNTDKYYYLFFTPALGYNNYDKFMVGGLIHNYTLPQENFQFYFSPMYATASKKLKGIGGLNYHWFPQKGFQKIQVGINGTSYSTNHGLDTSNNKMFESLYKITPYVKVFFKTPVTSHRKTWIDFRTFFITENSFTNYEYKSGSDSMMTYPTQLLKTHHYINQLTFNAEDNRALYPYHYSLQIQQGKGFYRINATGNYFFNYADKGGLTARIFVAKFGYIGQKDFGSTYLYQPGLLGANGTEDYTYSGYFLGRSASTSYGDIPLKNDGLAAQQIRIENTGGLKFRLDPMSYRWKSENWIAAANFNSTLPYNLFKTKLPVRLFLDVGTYAEAWQQNSAYAKFIYVGGVQLTFLKNLFNIYVPLIYSNEFREYLKTDAEANKFLKKITFSIDLQNFRLNKLLNLPEF